MLELVAKKIHHLGPVGAGSGAKVVNNAVMHALMVVLIEAGALAAKLGIPLDALVEILGSADGVTRPLQHRFRERILGGDYEGGMSVANARKDSMLALETAQDCGAHALRNRRKPRPGRARLRRARQAVGRLVRRGFQRRLSDALYINR